MFTGIIEKLGTVIAVTEGEREREFLIDADLGDAVIGESIAINGVCLTITHLDGDSHFRFYASPETMDRTSLSQLGEGCIVNMERALKAEMRLSGHIVQGHVDGTATIEDITPRSESHRFSYCLEETLARYCVEKGSIAIDGVSLTINAVEAFEGRITLISTDIIPHTWQQTNFHAKQRGDTVNVELDIFAKYLEKLCRPYRAK